MYPPLGLGQVRVSPQDVAIGGRLNIPKGTLVWVPHHGIMNTEVNWEKPRLFQPGNRYIPVLSNFCIKWWALVERLEYSHPKRDPYKIQQSAQQQLHWLGVTILKYSNAALRKAGNQYLNLTIVLLIPHMSRAWALSLSFKNAERFLQPDAELSPKLPLDASWYAGIDPGELAVQNVNKVPNTSRAKQKAPKLLLHWPCLGMFRKLQFLLQLLPRLWAIPVIRSWCHLRESLHCWPLPWWSAGISGIFIDG